MMLQFTNTMRVLYEYGEKIKGLYLDKNLQSGYDPSAELQNVQFTVEHMGGTFSIVFNMPDYFRWAENGRGPGKMPPPGVLFKWMEFHQIMPQPVELPNGRTYLPSMQSVEYLIRRKIGRDGTQGSHNWEATETEIRESLIAAVKNALEKDFSEYMETVNANR